VHSKKQKKEKKEFEKGRTFIKRSSLLSNATSTHGHVLLLLMQLTINPPHGPIRTARFALLFVQESLCFFHTSASLIDSMVS